MDALDAWGIKVTPKLLAKPTEDFTKLVYGKCLEMVFGITADMLDEAVNASLIGIRPENMVRTRFELGDISLMIARRTHGGQER